LKEAIRLVPNDAGAHTNLGNALKDSGNLPGAIAAYNEAIRREPKHALAYYNLGIALKGSGDLHGAMPLTGIQFELTQSSHRHTTTWGLL
jgi:Flp pilus assembly protein TadD